MMDRDLERAAILIIDDEEANVELLESFLAEGGYENVTSTRDPGQVLPLYDRLRPDLILLDLHMPHMDGFAVMRQLAGRIPEDEFVPILVLTADITPVAKQRALTGGANDFLSKPLDEVEVLLRIRNLLETRFLHVEQRTAREKAERGERRAAFLAEASRVLATSFDSQTTLSRLAQLAVPCLADLCMIDLADGAGGFRRVGLAYDDPDGQSLLSDRESAGPPTVRPDDPFTRLMAEGEPLLFPEFPEDLIGTGGGEGDPPDVWTRIRPRSLVAAPLVSSSGQTLGGLALVAAASGRRYEADDLTLAEELAHRAALAIDNARLFDEAQQALRARDEVLAVVAHDLRNPLNTIDLAAALLLETAPESSQTKHLEIVSRSAKRMDALIQDLLEVTRLESGRLKIELRPAHVGPLLREAAAMLRPLATARSIELEVEVDDTMRPVLMDSARILQVISNLVGNAIKFTPADGSIRLGCQRTERDVRFTVADTGAGIPPEQLPHVFGRFWQANGSDRRGIGLGLSIARGIVEAHGGAIWVESTLGDGTTFSFTLPLAPTGERTRDAGPEISNVRRDQAPAGPEVR